MTKNLQISMVLGLLLCLAAGQKLLNGFTTFNTLTDNNPACFMVIDGYVKTDTGDRITVEQSYRSAADQPPAALPSGCNYHNFKPDSFFHMDSFDPNNAFLIYQNDSNSDFIIESTFFPSAIQMSNGPTCVSLPQTDNAALQQYVCKTLYDATPVYFVVAGSGNLTFNATGSDNSSYFVAGAEENLTISNSANSVNLNASFPSIVGWLYDACNGTNETISSLSNEVTVTTSVDLSANIGGMWLSWALVRQNNSAVGEYSTVSWASKTPLFTGAPNSAGCWDMGIKYSDLMSNITYCSQGCSVSFVLTDANNRIYVLKTYGLWTAKNDSNPNGGSGSTGGNGTNNGNGTTGVNGTTGGNNTNNGVVKSAVSLGFNMLVLLISLVFLAKL